MEQARIEHAPNGSFVTYMTSADALVNKANNGDPDQIYLGLHCLPMSKKKGVGPMRLKRVSPDV